MTSSYKDFGWQDASKLAAHEYLFPAVRTALGKVDGPILDIGCGNGWIARALLAEGYDVWGVDASESGIAFASQRSPGRFFLLNIESGELPAELAGKSFKTIISTELIEHLYNPRGFLDFSRKILARAGGGRLIISTPYNGYLKYLAIAIIGEMDTHLTVLLDGGHIKFFSRNTLGRMLREQGYRVTNFAGAGRLPWLWKSMVISAEV